jgi:hypothetical protein
MSKTFKWSLSFQTIQVARLSQAQKMELNTNTEIWILDLPHKCKTITWEPESQPSACSQIYLMQRVVWKFNFYIDFVATLSTSSSSSSSSSYSLFFFVFWIIIIISPTSNLRKYTGWSSVTSTLMTSLWVMPYLWDCQKTSTKFYY